MPARWQAAWVICLRTKSTSKDSVVRAHLLDTGPLVAFLDRSDHHHLWAAQALAGLPAPLHTGEAILTEALYLLQNIPGAQDRVLDLVESSALVIHTLLPAEVQPLRKFLKKYEPADYADACLVRLSEIHQDSALVTVDADFRRYRRHRNQPIPLLAPWSP